MTTPPDSFHHYRRFVILCAPASIRAAKALILALRLRGYDADLPSVSTDDGRTVALAFWSDATRADEQTLSLLRTAAEAAEIMPTIVLRLCEAPLPLFARDLPIVDGREVSVRIVAQRIEPVLRTLAWVTLQPVSLREDMSYRSALPIFICHASEDIDDAKWLSFQMRQSGFAPWLDVDDLRPGQNWEYEIRAVIRRAAAVVACLSERSVSKFGYVQKELRLALDAADETPDGAVFVVPLRLDNCELPDRLRRWQWLDGVDLHTYSRLVSVLDECVRRRLA
jgi:hypothetical protein